jgi:putative transposase
VVNFRLSLPPFAGQFWIIKTKVAILKRHLVERAANSDLCDEHGLHPTMFYRWQKEFLEKGASAFNGTQDPRSAKLEKKVNEREDKLSRKHEVLSELMEEHMALKKKTWGDLRAVWVPHDIRDAIVDFVRTWAEKTGIAVLNFVRWLKLAPSRFYDWKNRYGRVNLHNGWIPRDSWLEAWEREAILRYYRENPTEGYRRATFMMLDRDLVAVSPSTVYRVLKDAGLLRRWNPGTTSKGKGFEQPVSAHEHWQVDVSYLNICGTFYYLCSVLDGYSRFIVHWEIRESMTEADVEIVLQRAREKFQEVTPRIISDNGPQFIAKDFKEFIRVSGMSHVRTRPFYPQSNGKIERWHGVLKAECIRPKVPLSLPDARRIVGDFVIHYNDLRLHSAIGFVTPRQKLEGQECRIFAERDQKLAAARENRRNRHTGILEHEVGEGHPVALVSQQHG